MLCFLYVGKGKVRLHQLEQETGATFTVPPKSHATTSTVHIRRVLCLFN